MKAMPGDQLACKAMLLLHSKYSAFIRCCSDASATLRISHDHRPGTASLVRKSDVCDCQGCSYSICSGKCDQTPPARAHGSRWVRRINDVAASWLFQDLIRCAEGRFVGGTL